jgi:glucose/arabinose dehydrogenase
MGRDMSATFAGRLILTPVLVVLSASVATAQLFPQDAVRGEPLAEEVPVIAFQPAPILIRLDELPPPFHSDSASRAPQVVEPPADAHLEVPEGFRVQRFAQVPNARWLALAPTGEVLCATSGDSRIVVLSDANGDGVAEDQYTLVDPTTGTNLPFGMAFHEQWLFLGNTDAVVRFEWAREDQRLVLRRPTRISELPGRGYNQHWTRNVIVAPDGHKLYVSVGSETNADVEQPPRAAILEMNLDGTERRVWASGLRNPVGLAFHPRTMELFTTVNERDGLGDDLVPDYLTSVREGAFYGWPYAYLSPQHLDPRHVHDGQSASVELAARTTTPDVLFQAHSAALGLAFAGGESFPERYRDGAFVAMRGSWNRHSGTGYKIAFVPFENGRPVGHYEDFVRGFLIDPAGPTTWGRPVGVLAMPDGSLLFTEEANGWIYRVSYEASERR